MFTAAETATDLVTWMQSVDASRAELRELHEMYAARMEGRFRENEARLDARFAQVDTRFAKVEASLDARFAQVDTRFAQVERLIEQQHGRLLAWSFGFWATTLTALIVLLRGA